MDLFATAGGVGVGHGPLGDFDQPGGAAPAVGWRGGAAPGVLGNGGSGVVANGATDQPSGAAPAVGLPGGAAPGVFRECGGTLQCAAGVRLGPLLRVARAGGEGAGHGRLLRAAESAGAVEPPGGTAPAGTLGVAT